MPIQNLHEILDRCARGDSRAFRTVMEEYQGYAYAVAIRIVGDEDDAEDIVQEAFIRVWNNFGRYNPAVKFTTWLYAIVTNLCLDTLRARTKRPAQSIDESICSTIASTAPEGDPEKVYASNELAALLGALTEELPPKQKIIFVLRDLEELSIRDVCDILHLSESSVKTNLVYARKHLREKLERSLAIGR